MFILYKYKTNIAFVSTLTNNHNAHTHLYSALSKAVFIPATATVADNRKKFNE